MLSAEHVNGACGTDGDQVICDRYPRDIEAIGAEVFVEVMPWLTWHPHVQLFQRTLSPELRFQITVSGNEHAVETRLWLRRHLDIGSACCTFAPQNPQVTDQAPGRKFLQRCSLELLSDPSGFVPLAHPDCET